MSTISKEYGGALFLAAKEEDNASDGYLKQVFNAVMLCSRLFKENPLYVSFLKTPDIPLEDRLSAVHDALNGRVPEYVDNFIELLTERGYIDRFPNVRMSLSSSTMPKTALPRRKSFPPCRLRTAK